MVFILDLYYQLCLLVLMHAWDTLLFYHSSIYCCLSPVLILGVDPKLKSKILDPNHLNKVADTFSNLTHVIRRHGPWTSAWVGESGGAFNSGGLDVSDTFINSFWLSHFPNCFNNFSALSIYLVFIIIKD